jgi:hypothetical protein
MSAGGYESWFLSARELVVSSDRGVYEYGTRQGLPGMVLESLPEG